MTEKRIEGWVGDLATTEGATVCVFRNGTGYDSIRPATAIPATLIVQVPEETCGLSSYRGAKGEPVGARFLCTLPPGHPGPCSWEQKPSRTFIPTFAGGQYIREFTPEAEALLAQLAEAVLEGHKAWRYEDRHSSYEPFALLDESAAKAFLASRETAR